MSTSASRTAMLLLTAFLALLILPARWPATGLAYAQIPAIACPERPSGGAGAGFSGKDVSYMNFRGQDLTNADFSGATLKGTVFIGANLSGANFSNARILPSDNEDARPTDFTGANLDAACFIGADFQGRTYFTLAKLSCADFSQTDISAHAIFGPAPLDFDRAACRPAFRATVMNCEFIDDWADMNLGAAGTAHRTSIAACDGQLSGRNFAGAHLAGINLAGAILDGTNFTGADLSQANLEGASLQCLDTGNGKRQCTDLSNARLQGASLDRANLNGAILYNAFLSNHQDGNISQAATLTNAHLKNANLSFAQLSGVDFTSANFYGDNPGPCLTALPNNAGPTRGCASAHLATMTETRFADAYLYGVDFSGAAIRGADFSRTVLAGANFAGASIATSPNGSRTSLRAAHLQGTNLDLAALLSEADLTDAFVDFRSGGNLIYFNLDGAGHNRFPCAPGCRPSSGDDVCTLVRFPVTSVPAANPGITCPDGALAGPGGCGAAEPGGTNRRWASGRAADAAAPPAWYRNPATYTPEPPAAAAICGGRGAQAAVTLW
ncbi:MAG: pentapeptide repeat-containing protein [Noviherbaspirillum sp.]